MSKYSDLELEYPYRRVGRTRRPGKPGKTKLRMKIAKRKRNPGHNQLNHWFEQFVHVLHAFDVFDRIGMTIAMSAPAKGKTPPAFGSISRFFSQFYNEGYIEAVPHAEDEKAALARVYTEQEVKRLPGMKRRRLNYSRGDWKGSRCYRKTSNWPKFLTRFREFKENGEG